MTFSLRRTAPALSFLFLLVLVASVLATTSSASAAERPYYCEGTPTLEGCEEAPQPVDACPGDLNPGYQAPGTVCNVPAPVDACPGDLNPGVQAAGTVCNVPAPVDACPDDLNPGVQAAGTTCATAPGQADSPAPAVDLDHEPTLGNADAPSDPVDGKVVTVTVDGGGTDGELIAAADTTGTADAANVGSATATTAPAATAYTGSGSLPYTGMGLLGTTFVGLAMLLAGVTAHVVSTRRRAAAE